MLIGGSHPPPSSFAEGVKSLALASVPRGGWPYSKVPTHEASVCTLSVLRSSRAFHVTSKPHVDRRGAITRAAHGIRTRTNWVEASRACPLTLRQHVVWGAARALRGEDEFHGRCAAGGAVVPLPDLETRLAGLSTPQ